MSNSGLPQATSSQKSVKLGNITIKAEKPRQSFDEAKKAIDELEQAAKNKVFMKNEPSEENK